MRVVCNDVVSNHIRAIRAETIFPEVPRAKHKLIGRSVSTGSDNGMHYLPRDWLSPSFPRQQAVAASRHGTSRACEAEGGSAIVSAGVVCGGVQLRAMMLRDHVRCRGRQRDHRSKT